MVAERVCGRGSVDVWWRIGCKGLTVAFWWLSMCVVVVAHSVCVVAHWVCGGSAGVCIMG